MRVEEVAMTKGGLESANFKQKAVTSNRCIGPQKPHLPRTSRGLVEVDAAIPSEALLQPYRLGR